MTIKGTPPYSFEEIMKHCFGEIERKVYAAEQKCDKIKRCSKTGCAFQDPIVVDQPACRLAELRALLGDHVEQHDAMRECPL